MRAVLVFAADSVFRQVCPPLFRPCDACAFACLVQCCPAEAGHRRYTAQCEKYAAVLARYGV